LFSDKYIKLNDDNYKKLKKMQTNICKIKGKNSHTFANYGTYLINNKKLKSRNTFLSKCAILNKLSNLDRCG